MNESGANNKRKPLLILAVVLVIAAGFVIFYWIRSSAYETTDDAQLDGNIYSVRAGITAYLDSVYFRDNQQVKKGDTLFVFNTSELKAGVQQAKAALESAKTGLSVSGISAEASAQNAMASRQTALSGKQSVAAAQANLEKAQNDFDRAKQLLKINGVTQVQYDADETTLRQAKADYERAIHQQQSAVISSLGLNSQAKAAHHQISAALALVDERKAELKLAQEQLQRAYVLAPSDGIVTKRDVNQGQYVLSGQSLCAVVNESHLWVTANFKETQIRKMKPGQDAVISVDAWPGLKLKGTVQSYAGATGSEFSLIPPDNATGNFIKVTQRVPIRIRIDSFSDPGNKQAVLFPGLSAFVRVRTD